MQNPEMAEARNFKFGTEFDDNNY